MVNNQNTLTNT